MSYIDLKISDQEAGANNVQSAPNVLIKTPQENKAVFDALPDIVRQRFNSLIDELTQGGYLPLQGQEDLIIRINSTNGKMEFSLDAGQTWQASANEGHRILTSDGTVMPQRSDLRFEGANVRTEENQTIVNFQSGAQGIPTGGTTGQVLKKVSNESYDAYWSDKALDSERLGGIASSEYMRFSTFGDPDSPTSVLTSTNATEHIEKKDNPHQTKFGQMFELIWENPNPSTDIGNFSVPFDSLRYSAFIVAFRSQIASEHVVWSGLIPVTDDTPFRLQAMANLTNLAERLCRQQTTVISIGNGTLNAVTNTSAAVPNFIYGIK